MRETGACSLVTAGEQAEWRRYEIKNLFQRRSRRDNEKGKEELGLELGSASLSRRRAHREAPRSECGRPRRQRRCHCSELGQNRTRQERRKLLRPGTAALRLLDELFPFLIAPIEL